MEVEAAVPVAGVPMKALAELFNAAPVAAAAPAGAVHRRRKEASSPGLKIPDRTGNASRYEFIFTFKTRRAAPRRGPPGGRRRLEVRRPALLHHGGRPGHSRGHRQDRSSTRSTYLEDTFYVEQALGRGRSGGWAIRATPLLASQLPSEPLNNYKVIYLRQPAGPGRRHRPSGCGPTSRRRQPGLDLRRQRQARTSTTEMNEKAQQPAPAGRCWSVRAPPAGSERRTVGHIGSLDKKHPALKHAQRAALALPVGAGLQARQHRRAASGPAGPVLARLDDGEPLLVQAKFGKGTSTLAGHRRP